MFWQLKGHLIYDVVAKSILDGKRTENDGNNSACVHRNIYVQSDQSIHQTQSGVKKL